MNFFNQRIVLSVSLLFSMSAITTADAVPPVEAFGKRPMISDVVISPGGTHYAALQWVKGKEIIAIYNLYPKSADDRVKMLSTEISKKIEEKVESIVWLSDNTLGAVFQWEGKRGTMGVPVSETRLVAMKSDFSDLRQIPRPSKSSTYQSQIQHRVLDYLDDDPDHILMALDREGYGRTLNVYRVNIHNGTIKNITKGGMRVAYYMTDQSSKVRLRWVYSDTKGAIELREPTGRVWSRLFEFERTDGPEFWPEIFTSNPDRLIVSQTSDAGFEEMFEYDLKTRNIVKSAYSVESRDVSGVATNRYSQAITGYYIDDHTDRLDLLDPILKSVQSRIDAKLAGTSNTMTSYDRHKNKFTVFATGPKVPGAYYMYLRSTDQMVKILDRNALPLDVADLGDMKVISYAARDGQNIPAYLTTPPAALAAQAPFPLIVMPHGGPTSRDSLGYDYWVQFLASRGYAVLQPQFRGSTGFGAGFQKAGYRQWGLLMQDDVTDGARAMIAQGVADPDRMCIVGGSYGGYAALMGAVVTPDLFQCAVSFAGVSDIDRMIAQDQRYKFAMNNPPNVGSRRDDKDQLRDTSPINNIDAIKVPVLLVHGDKDLSVNASHSKRMARALKRARKPHKLVILKDGNHHLQLERHRIRFLKELETFLGEHIGR